MNKTIKEKIEKSAVATAGIALIVAVVFACTGIAALIGVFKFDIITSAADYAGIAAESIMLMIIAIICFNMFRRISKCGTPFSEYNVKSLRVIALITIAKTIVTPAVVVITLSILSGRLMVEGFTFDMTASLVVGGLLMVLANIFNYGYMLQQESDETL